LFDTAGAAQKHGDPYFFYFEESIGERNAMPVKKQPLQYVPKLLDWYCRICGYWVDDDQESIVCSHDECEDVYHLSCTGLKALPEGDWFCPAPGCIHSRGSILPKVVPGAAPCSHKWEAMPPLTVGNARYRRVMCDDERVYYALTPFAQDMTGLQGKELVDAMRVTSGYPDFVYMRESVFPHDVARLRELRMMNEATRNRAFITVEALFRAFKKPLTPFVEQQFASLRAALAADEQQQNAAESSAAGMKRGREDDVDEKDDEDKTKDLDEEIAVPAHPVLDNITLLQQDITRFKATITGLESELASLKKAVEEKIAASHQKQEVTTEQQQPQQPVNWQ